MFTSVYLLFEGDALRHHHGHKFSTRDQDNDVFYRSCAVKYKGGWWYGSCHNANLNGLYLRGNQSSYGDGVQWKLWTGYYYSLRFTEMKIRPFHVWDEWPRTCVVCIMSYYLALVVIKIHCGPLLFASSWLTRSRNLCRLEINSLALNRTHMAKTGQYTTKCNGDRVIQSNT